MATSTSRQNPFTPRWSHAGQLAAALCQGHPLPALENQVPLGDGEVLHARVELAAWRFHSLDISVERLRTPATGGAITVGFIAAATAVGNRRARAEAERLAAPQWRPLGYLPMLATSQRLLVLHEGMWASVWYSAIRHIVPHLDDDRLELVFDDDPPYALRGEWVPYLAVVLTAALAEQCGAEAVASMLLSV